MTRTGATTSALLLLLLWDPFGQPVDPVSFAIGTVVSDDTGQLAGNTLWHQGALKPAESAGSALVVEMGVPLYVPALGRFLQVDPVEGGVDSDYVWPTDPIRSADLDGEFDWLFALDVVSTAIMFVPGVGTAAGLAIKAAVVATRLVVGAVRATTVVRTITSAINVVRTVIEKNNLRSSRFEVRKVAMMRSNIQIEAFLLRIADEAHGCEAVVETEQNAVRMWLRRASSPARVASVSRIDGSKYGLWLDHLYAMVWVDEDLSPSEEKEVLRRLAKIGGSYVMQGGKPGRAGLLRTPYLEVHADDESARVYRPFGWQSDVLPSPWEGESG